MNRNSAPLLCIFDHFGILGKLDMFTHQKDMHNSVPLLNFWLWIKTVLSWWTSKKPVKTINVNDVHPGYVESYPQNFAVELDWGSFVPHQVVIFLA